MIFLYILLSIIAFTVLLFCIKIVAVVDYDKNLAVDVRWLFLKFHVYPLKKKPEKEAKEEKKEPKEKKPDKKEKKKKTKKSNPLKSFYENQGFSGVLELITNTASSVGGLFKRMFKAFTINKLNLKMSVSSSDAAKTAIDYGKICAVVFPALGTVFSTVKVKKHDIDVSPNFLETESKAKFNIVISVIPIKLTNAAVVLAVQLLFKVLLKLFLGSRKSKNEKVLN